MVVVWLYILVLIGVRMLHCSRPLSELRTNRIYATNYIPLLYHQPNKTLIRQTMYIQQQYIVVCLVNHCCHIQATIHSLFIVVGTDVAVNNTEVFIVSMEMQQWVPCALLFSYKIFCTATNNRKHYIQSIPGVKFTTSGFNSRADSESKMSYTHMGPIRDGSGVMSF